MSVACCFCDVAGRNRVGFAHMAVRGEDCAGLDAQYVPKDAHDAVRLAAPEIGLQ